MKGKLFCVNKIPSCNCPKQVFDKTITNEEFMTFLLEHFGKGNRKVIMIDDGLFAKCIFGIGKDQEKSHYYLLIGDPHMNHDL